MTRAATASVQEKLASKDSSRVGQKYYATFNVYYVNSAPPTQPVSMCHSIPAGIKVKFGAGLPGASAHVYTWGWGQQNPVGHWSILTGSAAENTGSAGGYIGDITCPFTETPPSFDFSAIPEFVVGTIAADFITISPNNAAAQTAPISVILVGEIIEDNS